MMWLKQANNCFISICAKLRMSLNFSVLQHCAFLCFYQYNMDNFLCAIKSVGGLSEVACLQKVLSPCWSPSLVGVPTSSGLLPQKWPPWILRPLLQVCNPVELLHYDKTAATHRRGHTCVSVLYCIGMCFLLIPMKPEHLPKVTVLHGVGLDSLRLTDGH